MTQLRRVWVYLTDEEAKKLNIEGVVELKNITPQLLGKVWGFKNKPEVFQ
jgi:hypothetical protein